MPILAGRRGAVTAIVALADTIEQLNITNVGARRFFIGPIRTHMDLNTDLRRQRHEYRRVSVRFLSITRRYARIGRRVKISSVKARVKVFNGKH